MLSTLNRILPRFPYIKRSFSATQLSANDDTFLLLQHQHKSMYILGNTHTPNKADTIFEIIQEIKPDTVLLQICQHRADVLQRISAQYGDDLNDDICYSTALEDFANKYPLSSDIFSKSKTVIKPFELFGLLFSYSHYRAIHSALLNQSQLIFVDNNLKQCIAKFEKSINKMYDPSSCLTPQNMFEKDIYAADLERELSMGASPREVQKRLMKQMMERMLKNRPNDQQKANEEKKKRLYLNQQLEIDLIQHNEMDWNSIYTRQNARVLINELKDTMKVCVDNFIDERNKSICDILMNCDGKNIVAFVNFANMDGIEDKYRTI